VQAHLVALAEQLLVLGGNPLRPPTGATFAVFSRMKKRVWAPTRWRTVLAHGRG
jgi:hypothetical protein